MKKSFLGFAAVATILMASSCSNEELVNPNVGTPGSVTFNVSIAQSLSTRAISDGKGATQLYYQLYTVNANDNETDQVQGGELKLDELKNSLTLTGLNKDTEYIIAFWAQNPECKVYDVTDLRAVKIDYENGNLKNNDESMDAFCASSTFTPTGQSVPVTLKRPFAQINVGLPELPENATKSEVTISGELCDTYNILTQKASNQVSSTITFAANDLPDQKLSAVSKEYEYASMTYVLVNGSANLNYALKLGEEADYVKENNLPVKTNYRTNILGMEPGSAQFEIVVDPQYGETDTNVGEVRGTVTVSNIKAEYSNGKLDLSADYEADEEIESATFVLTPGTRAAESVIRIAATEIDATTIKASYTDPIEPGSYIISIEVPGYSVEASEEDVEESNGTLIVPEEEDSEIPEAYLYGSFNGWNHNSEGSKFEGKKVGGNYVYSLTCTIPVNAQIRIGGQNPDGGNGDYYDGAINYTAKYENSATLTSEALNKEIDAIFGSGNTTLADGFEGTITLTIPANYNADEKEANNGKIKFEGKALKEDETEPGTDPNEPEQPGEETGVPVVFLFGELEGAHWGQGDGRYKFEGKDSGEFYEYTLTCHISAGQQFKFGGQNPEGGTGDYYQGRINFGISEEGTSFNNGDNPLTPESYGKELTAKYKGGNVKLSEDFTGTITLKIPVNYNQDVDEENNGTVIFNQEN